MAKVSRGAIAKVSSQMERMRRQVETLREDQTEDLYNMDGTLKRGRNGISGEIALQALMSAVDEIDAAIGHLEQAMLA